MKIKKRNTTLKKTLKEKIAVKPKEKTDAMPVKRSRTGNKMRKQVRDDKISAAETYKMKRAPKKGELR